MLTDWLSFSPALLVNRGVIRWQEALQTGTEVACYLCRDGYVHRGIMMLKGLSG